MVRAVVAALTILLVGLLLVVREADMRLHPRAGTAGSCDGSRGSPATGTGCGAA